MKVQALDNQESPSKFAAAYDARMRNIAVGSTYSQKEKTRADRMKFALELCFNFKEIHINYRQKFIAVKVDNAVVKNRKDLALLESDWEKEGIVKRTSAQGVIYHIPRV